MSNSIVESVRKKYPQYADISDDELTLKIGERYPVYLETADFATDFKRVKNISLQADEGRRQVDLSQPARSPEELAIKNTEARKQLMDMGLVHAGPQPRGGFGGLYDFLATPTTDFISKSLSFTAQQLQDAEEAMAQYAARASGDISAEETQAALAEPSQPPTTAAKIATGAHQATVESMDFFTSPLGIMTLGTAKLPVPMQRVVAATFVADMARHTPEQLRELNAALKTDDVERQAKAATALGLTGAFIKTGVTHASKPGGEVRADAADQLQKVQMEEAIAKTEVTAPATAEALKEVVLPVPEKQGATAPTAAPEPVPVPPAAASGEIAPPAVERSTAGPPALAENTPERPIAPQVGETRSVPVPEEVPPYIGMPTQLPEGAPMIRASEIIKDLAEMMDRPIRVGHIAQHKAAGIFKPVLEVARLRRANDIPVATHEVAHGLERVHRRALGDISRQQWTQRIPSAARAELQGLDYDPTKRRAFEGFAEFVRHYLTIWDTATVAPNAHAWFEGTFFADNPQLRESFAAIRQKIVQFQQQGAVNRVRSMVQMMGEEAKRPMGERLKARKERAIALMADDLRPLEMVEREILEGGLELGAASPTKLARTVTQSSGARARHWALKGMTDFAGNRTGPGLKEIFAQAGIKGDEINAILYSVASRAVELHKRGIHPGIEKVDAEYAVQALRTPERVQFAEAIRRWNEGALDYLRDAGGITRDTFDAMTAQNQAYIPFFRVFEEQLGTGFATGGRRIGDTPKPIKQLKGSGREITDPIGAMQQHANQIIAVADKVRVSKKLVELAESKTGFGKYVEEIPASKVPVEFTVGRVKDQLQAAGADLTGADLDAVMTLFLNAQRNPAGANIVSFVRNGERKFYELDPELYRTIQALEHRQLHPFMDLLLGKLARTTRLGATGVRAGFTLITNPIRDFATTLLQAKGNPMEAAALTLKHLGKQIGLQDSEIKNLWRATGGEITQPLGLDRKSLKTSIDEVLANSAKRKALHIVRHPVEFAREALSFTEAAPRLAEFEMALRELGWQPGQRVTNDMAIEAANRAAEVTVNFRRAGAWGRTLNQVTAFFNPAVQGLSKFNRAHRENPKSAALRGLAFITLPAVANWLVNRDDPEWKNLPAWVKYGFLNFKVGGEWIRIPTPFEWWYAYGAVPVSALDAAYQKHPAEVGKALEQAVKQLTPPVVPSATVPPLEVLANRSFLTGKPIVTEREKQLAPSAQAKPWTSQTVRTVAEVLSQGGVEVSPAKIEHILNGETGGLWGDVIGLGERAAGIAPLEVRDEPADLPVVGRLFVRDASSELIDTVYTDMAHLEGRDKAFRKYLADGDERRAAMYELTPEESTQLKVLQAAAKRLSGLRKILASETDRTKRQELFKEMRDVAAVALDVAEESSP